MEMHVLNIFPGLNREDREVIFSIFESFTSRLFREIVGNLQGWSATDYRHVKLSEHYEEFLLVIGRKIHAIKICRKDIGRHSGHALPLISELSLEGDVDFLEKRILDFLKNQKLEDLKREAWGILVNKTPSFEDTFSILPQGFSDFFLQKSEKSL
jgi:hypothetical protein